VVFEWHSHFKASQVSAKDDECSGWPSTSKTTENVEEIWELIQKDRHRTIHELPDTAGINYGVCQEIVTENLNMRRIATKFVPLLLTNDQKQLREKTNEDQTFISRIIMGDGSWIYGYDPDTKQQSSHWRSHNHQEHKGTTGPEFNKEHAHCFFRRKEDCSLWICFS
jgi:1,2-phenylacetyl-CoA epoxidase PaaB subunit